MGQDRPRPAKNATRAQRHSQVLGRRERAGLPVGCGEEGGERAGRGATQPPGQGPRDGPIPAGGPTCSGPSQRPPASALKLLPHRPDFQEAGVLSWGLPVEVALDTSQGLWGSGQGPRGGLRRGCLPHGLPQCPLPLTHGRQSARAEFAPGAASGPSGWSWQPRGPCRTETQGQVELGSGPSCTSCTPQASRSPQRRS